MSKPVINLMFDSGAYSAFTQKKPIDIKAYADFLLVNKDHIGTPVNLDAINPEGPEVAAEQGWNNFCYLRDRGIMTMPVFHARESVKWLQKMLEACPYIGLSGTSLVSPSEHMAWYSLMWQMVTDSLGRPIANFHAFGDTAPVSLKRYPWFSADSATWQIQAGKTGSVVMTAGGKIGFRGRDPRPIKMKSKTVKDDTSIGKNKFSKNEIIGEADSKRWGLNLPLIMASDFKAVEMTAFRCLMNASYLLELQEATRNTSRFIYREGIGLASLRGEGIGKEREGPVKLFFVVSTAVCGWALPVLTKLGIRNILLSYYYTEKKFWEREFVPFLYDPEGQCQSNPRFKRFWDLLDKFSLEKELTTVGAMQNDPEPGVDY